jgi:hypothetical protein
MSEGVWQKKYEELVSRLKIMSVHQTDLEEETAIYPAKAIAEVTRKEAARQFGHFIMDNKDAYRLDEIEEGNSLTHKTYSVVVLTNPNPWELK